MNAQCPSACCRVIWATRACRLLRAARRQCSVELAAGVVYLARLLAKEPRVSIELWHRER